MKRMKTDPVVKKEVCFMALASLVCACLVQGGFLIAGCFDKELGWGADVLLGGVIGWAMTVVNFWLMSRGVQKAVSAPDPQHAQLLMKVSYTWRTIGMIGVMALSLLIDAIHWLPVVAAAFYPSIVIFVRQFWTKYIWGETGDDPLPAGRETDAAVEDTDEDEDEFEKAIGSFARKINTDYRTADTSEIKQEEKEE